MKTLYDIYDGTCNDQMQYFDKVHNDVLANIKWIFDNTYGYLTAGSQTR